MAGLDRTDVRQSSAGLCVPMPWCDLLGPQEVEALLLPGSIVPALLAVLGVDAALLRLARLNGIVVDAQLHPSDGKPGQTEDGQSAKRTPIVGADDQRKARLAEQMLEHLPRASGRVLCTHAFHSIDYVQRPERDHLRGARLPAASPSSCPLHSD